MNRLVKDVVCQDKCICKVHIYTPNSHVLMVKRSSIRFCELPFLPGKCGTVFRRENNDYFKHWIGPFSNILGHLFAHFPLDPLSFSLHGLQQCGPHCLKEGYSRPESKGLVLGRDTDTGVIRQLDSIGMYCMSVYPRNGLKVDNFNRKMHFSYMSLSSLCVVPCFAHKLYGTNCTLKDQIFTLEVESPETPEVQRVHNGSL